MAHVWNFSPSSLPCLQLCIEAALLQETDNKWTRKFGRKTSKISENVPDFENNEAIEIIDENTPTEEELKKDSLKNYDDFLEALENDFRLDFVVEEFTKSPDIVQKLGERLSSNLAEKLFNLILSTEEVCKEFLNNILLIFLPIYLKRENRISVDKLIKISDIYPEHFQELLKVLIKDTEIPTEFLNSYISTLDGQKCGTFLEILTIFDMTSTEFIHKLSLIELAYTQSVKTERIQEFIKNCLLKHYSTCDTQRSYGKLFMTYLQTEKSLGHSLNVKQLEECLENHRSPFRRPCLTLLKEFGDE